MKIYLQVDTDSINKRLGLDSSKFFRMRGKVDAEELLL